jgi:hypothetical protein
MNQENQEKIVCPRCGSQVSINSRCCLQCGWLNPNDPANQQVNEFIERNKEPAYQVGSLQNIAYKDGQVTKSIGSKTGNRKVCFLINYLLYIFVIVLSFLIIFGNSYLDFSVIKNSTFPYIAFITSIIFLYVYSMELVFIKANKKWWYSLVPFYNLFVLCEIVFKKKWLGIILLIPVIGQLFFIVVLYKLATKFKYSGLLTILFPIIYIPLMGFGSRLYEDIHYADEDLTLEKDYKRKKIFFISILLFLLLSSGFIFWNNIIEIKSKTFKLKNYYYIIATKQIVNKTKQLAKENYLECSDYGYRKDRGIYYVEYGDIGTVAYIPFHTYADVISGYVIIDNRSGDSKYYISITDGNYGYPETLYEDVNIDSIVPYEELVSRSDINSCRNTKPKATVGGFK